MIETRSVDPNNYIFGPIEEDIITKKTWRCEPSKEAQRVFEVLQQFYFDWQNGAIEYYQPDPTFEWNHIRRDLTDAEVDNMMYILEWECDKELAMGTTFVSLGYRVSIPFSSFPDNVKRTLAQRIVLQLDMPRWE